jgi:hypothetical protein
VLENRVYRCYICNEIIDDNNCSEEHIIPNCIGGRLKSKRLLCIDCNSESGLSLEVVIGKQFNFIANMLDIRRDRGQVPSEKLVNTNTGDEIYYDAGKPTLIKPTIVIDGNHYSISTKDMRQAKEVLNGLKRKHPQIDVNETLRKSSTKRKYLNDKYETRIDFGGPDLFKALTKMAINFYIYSDYELCHVVDVIDFFNGNREFKSYEMTNFYFQTQNVINKPDETIVHGIILVGNRKEHLLYCYVELFSFFQCLIALNRNYDGPDLYKEYHFDVIEVREISLQSSINLTRQDITDMLSSDANLFTQNMKALQAKLEKLIEIAMDRQRQSFQKNLIEKAISSVWQHEKYANEPFITPEMQKELEEVLAREITAYLCRIDDLDEIIE